ncbi:MAG: hypothetical protein ACOYO1_10300 [Bacteroidales bacterium]
MKKYSIITMFVMATLILNSSCKKDDSSSPTPPTVVNVSFTGKLDGTPVSIKPGTVGGYTFVDFSSRHSYGVGSVPQDTSCFYYTFGIKEKTVGPIGGFSISKGIYKMKNPSVGLPTLPLAAFTSMLSTGTYQITGDIKTGVDVELGVLNGAWLKAYGTSSSNATNPASKLKILSSVSEVINGKNTLIINASIDCVMYEINGSDNHHLTNGLLVMRVYFDGNNYN